MALTQFWKQKRLTMFRKDASSALFSGISRSLLVNMLPRSPGRLQATNRILPTDRWGRMEKPLPPRLLPLLWRVPVCQGELEITGLRIHVVTAFSFVALKTQHSRKSIKFIRNGTASAEGVKALREPRVAAPR